MTYFLFPPFEAHPLLFWVQTGQFLERVCWWAQNFSELHLFLRKLQAIDSFKFLSRNEVKFAESVPARKVSFVDGTSRQKRYVIEFTYFWSQTSPLLVANERDIYIYRYVPCQVNPADHPCCNRVEPGIKFIYNTQGADYCKNYFLWNLPVRLRLRVCHGACFILRFCSTESLFVDYLPKTNMTMDNPTFEDVYFLLNLGMFQCHASFRGGYLMNDLWVFETGIGLRVFSMAVHLAHCWRWWEIKSPGEMFYEWFYSFFHIPPKTITWIPKIMVWKRWPLSDMATFGIYVKVLGCNLLFLLVIIFGF